MGMAVTSDAAGAASRPFLVVNPRSAGGGTGRRWESIESRVRGVLGDVSVGMTAGPMDAVRLTREALRAGHRTVLAVGGDGTINEVVNGFFDDEGLPIAPGASLGLLPAGTGGDFRRTVAVPLELDATLSALASAKPRLIDVGRVRFVGHDGRPTMRHFINVTSFGISGAVADRVNASSKRLGRLSFTLGSLQALAGWSDVDVRVSVDDGPAQTLAVTCLAAANGRFFGGGMMVAPDARLDDGLLHVTVWAGYGLGTFIFRQPGIYSGAHLGWSGTRSMVARSLRLESDARVLVDVDGEQPGTLPATVELLPKAIGFLSCRALGGREGPLRRR